MGVGKITELVDDSAIAQLEALYQKLGITTQAMKEGVAAGTDYMNVMGKVSTITEFNTVSQQQVTVMGDVKQAQQAVVQTQQQIITTSNQAAEAVRTKMSADADATNVLTKLGGSIEDNNKLLAEQKIQLGQVTTQLKEHAQAVGGDVAAQVRNIETTAKLTQQQFLFKEAVAQTTLVIKQQTKEQLAAETSNDIYMAQLNQMIKLQNAMSVEERETTVYGRELQAQIDATKASVVAANEAQGKFNDNVGNYPGKAEPAIGAIEKTGKAMDITGRLTGVLTSRIFRMAASFLLITVALGAITWLYEYIKNLDIFTGRLDQTTQNLKALNDVQKSVSESAGESVGKFRILSDTIKDGNSSYEQRLAAANELKKLWPLELAHSTAQAIANGEESDSLDKLTDAVVKLAKAKAAANEIEKIEGQIIDLQIQRDKVNSAKASEILNTSRTSGLDLKFKTQGGATLRQTLLRESKERADEANKDIASQISIKENTIKYLEQYGGLQNEAETIEGKPKKGPKDKTYEYDVANAKAHLELVKAIAKETLDNEKLSYDQRLAALSTYIAASNKLIDIERRAKNRKPGITATEIDTNNTEAKTQGLGVTSFDNSEQERLAKERNDALRKNLEDLLKFEDDAAKKAIEISQNQTDDQLQILDEQKNKEETVIANKHKKGLLDEQEYRKELKRIADQYNIDRLGAVAFQEQTKLEILQAKENNDVSFAQGHNETPEQINDIKAKSGVAQQQHVVAKAGIALGDAINNQDQDASKPVDKKKAEIYALQQTAQVVDQLDKLRQKAYEAEIARLENLAKIVDQNATAEKNAVSNSILSSKEKAREIAVIDAQAQVQKNNIQAEENKIKQKEAEAEKEAAISKIILETAIAAIKAPAELGPILGLAAVPIVLALGAVELAAAAAAPIPKFEKGGRVSKSGPIITGEAGTELRIDPSGAMSFTADYENVSYAKAGTKIISNKELQRIVGKPEPVYYVNDTSTDNRKIEKLLQENNELQKRTKRPIVNVNVDRWGDYSRKRNY